MQLLRAFRGVEEILLQDEEKPDVGASGRKRGEEDVDKNVENEAERPTNRGDF
jgi:hypothetical protein